MSLAFRVAFQLATGEPSTMRQVVADTGQLECRTDDGMVLKYETTGRGSTSSFTATQVRAGGGPPEAIFAWLGSEPQH